jgi:[ribosomal protein S5]-alanine N-acetyltransferase
MTETERLQLLPLTYTQLHKYLRADGSLEEELGLSTYVRRVSDTLSEVFAERILPYVADTSKDFRYSTLWTMIDKDRQRMVGDLCFKGIPDAKGQVEIGYGTDKEEEGKGYMTEAVGGLIDWAKTQESVKIIYAFTRKNNLASQRILQKNGFVLDRETNTELGWRLIVRE